MATKVETKPSAGKYGWDRYVDGSTYRFVKGIDFDVQVRSFGNAARKAA
jgi:hypothetical protein